MKKITVELTEYQIELLKGILNGAIYHDDNEQSQAFKRRTLNILAKAKTV
jgi:hypothetical protein